MGWPGPVALAPAHFHARHAPAAAQVRAVGHELLGGREHVVRVRQAVLADQDSTPQGALFPGERVALSALAMPWWAIAFRGLGILLGFAGNVLSLLPWHVSP